MFSFFNRRLGVSAAALLVCTTALAYLGALFAPFQFDDKKALLYRRELHDLADLGSVIGFDPYLPRPLFHISLAFDWWLWGGRPFGFHLSNLILHLVVSVLLFDVFRRFLENAGQECPASGNVRPPDKGFKPLVRFKRSPVCGGEPEDTPGRDFWYAWLGALLFAVHPLLTESVTYVWSRSSVMSAMFWLLSLDLYLVARGWKCRGTMHRAPTGKHKRIRRIPPKAGLFYMGSFLIFLVSLACKEIAATLPGILLLIEISPEPRARSLKPKLLVIPFFAVVVLGLAARYALTGHLVFGDNVDYPHHIATQCRVTASYIGLILWPFHQNVDHFVPPSFPVWEVFLSLSLLAMILAAVVVLWKRSLAAFGMAWFFVTLSPFFFVPLKDQMVERNLYYPAMGFALLLAMGIRRAERRSGKAAIALAAAILSLYFAGTIHRNRVWGSEWSLWADAHRNAPDKARSYNYLGALCIERGRLDRAKYLLEAALGRAPLYAQAHHNLGVIALRGGDAVEAGYRFAVAGAYDPDMTSAFINQARAEIALGRRNKARKILETALERWPDNLDTRLLLADMFRMSGDIDRARELLEEALRIEPRSYEATLGMALLADSEGVREKSLMWLAVALAIDPERPEAHQALGRQYAKGGNWPSAVREFEKAIKAEPDNPGMYAELGIANVRLKRWDEARKAFLKEMRLRPHDPEPVLRLASVEEAVGNKNAAMGLYARAMELDTQGRYRAELEQILRRLQPEGEQ